MPRQPRSKVTIDDLAEFSSFLAKRCRALENAQIVGELFDHRWRVTAAYVEAMQALKAIDRLINEVNRSITPIDIHAQ
jgi:hypothetical protein